jgi:hypothetical protein
MEFPPDGFISSALPVSSWGFLLLTGSVSLSFSLVWNF